MAFAGAKGTSSSSFPIPPQSIYDVFLSFRGVDTRTNFTSHLLAALERHGFHTFFDDTKLEKGEGISSQLLKAIEESRISLVVLSRSYASSGWCLDELVKIMEYRNTLQHIVFPIFHGVDPSDVRRQKGSLAEAFAKHAERYKEDSGKVEKWKEALTQVANLSGWDLPKVDNGDEAKLIQKIVAEVRNKIDVGHLYVADHPVGLQSRLQKLNVVLSMESSDVRIVGIWGICGVGKTTIAKSLYNLIRHRFEGSSFLANVREISMQPNGLVVLQEKVLSDIFVSGTQNIKNVDQGIEVMKQRAFNRKVLLILDDVDDVQQLKALAIGRDSFASGSRIIITTRDRSSLNFLELDENEIYVPEELNKDESLELFSWHAFKEDHPNEDFVDLSDQVVYNARSLPLALKVLGSFLFRKSIPEWVSAIPNSMQILIDDIYGKLKTSFDSLKDEFKEIFLDMACFFAETNRDFTIKILEGRYSSAAIGIQVLADRCLIKYGPENELVMDDILINMGREIVRRQSVKDPGKRSRLWYHEEALEVLEDGTGTEVVEGLVLNFPKTNDVQVNAKAFEKMNRLWLLHLNHIHLSQGYEHISRKLLWLCWNGFVLQCVPSNLYMENLVALDLRYSSLKQVWNGTKVLAKLKFLYLSHCYYLTRTPDFSGLNNLEKLFLNDCVRLVEVGESIRCLNKLVALDLKNCKMLGKIPSSVWILRSLKCLDISGCSKLGQLSGFEGSQSASLRVTFVQGLSCLMKLSMENCYLPHLPCEIGSLISLEMLHIFGSSLLPLPSSICNLRRLKLLDLKDCHVSHLPGDIGELISLETLNLRGSNIIVLPSSICNLTRLKLLDLTDCPMSHLPGDIGGLISLETLILGGSSLLALPSSICNLTHLKLLDLKHCNVSHLPGDIGELISLETLDLGGSGLLALPSSICNLARLKLLDLKGCHVCDLPGDIGELISLETLNLGGSNLLALPSSICNLTRLKLLDLKDCHVSHLPGDIGQLISLETMNLGGSGLLALPSSICNLRRLKLLDLKDCHVSHLPGDIGELISLETLNLGGSNLIALPSSICDLTHLKLLDLTDCHVPHLPGDIGELISLETLNLGGCRLLALPSSICNLMRLRVLDLKDCRVSHLPGDIGELISLETLNLGGSGLLALPSSICNLTRLERLDLKDCHVSHLPGDIGGLISLETLNLCGNGLRALPDSICNLTRLKSLDLKDCNVSNLPRDIGGLISLETLDLGGNGLLSLPVSICNLNRLERLSLKGCNVSRLPDEIGRLSSLEHFDLRGNNIRTLPHGIRFIQRLPQSKGLSATRKSFDIILPGVELPSGFQYQNTGSYLSFVVPPLITQRILGWILCIVFMGHKKACEWSIFNYFVSYKTKEIENCTYHASLLPPITYEDQDQICLVNLPLCYLEGGDEVEISIESRVGKEMVKNPCLTVKKCGLKIIYEADEITMQE